MSNPQSEIGNPQSAIGRDVLVYLFFILTCLTGCAITRTATPVLPPPEPPLGKSEYVVQPGDTLWGIAHDFGLEIQAVSAANHLGTPTLLHAGQRLILPLPRESAQFVWPMRGQVTPLTDPSPTGTRRGGIEIAAPRGSWVRAARSGQVAMATHHFGDLGQTILLDHLDGYVSVYAGLDQLLVAPGTMVRQGVPLGRLGSTPLYFELRYRTELLELLRMLP